MWSIPTSNPEGRAFMALLICFLVLAVAMFCLRLYSRRIHKDSFDASDYACFFGLVLTIGLLVIEWGAYSHGWGQPKVYFTFADARFSSIIFLTIDPIQYAATASIRISMLLLYIRIFMVRRFKMICWSLIAVNVATLFSILLSTLLICSPITYSFDKTTPGGHCGDLTRFELFTAILNLVLDFIIVTLPMPMLWRLQMKIKQKVGISIVLGMGIIICILTLTRVLATFFYDMHDYTKQSALVSLITGLEPMLGVTIACLPFMPSVFKHLKQINIFTRTSKILTSTTKDDKGGSAAAINNIRGEHSGQSKELTDIEMDPINCASSGKTYVGTGSLNSMPEERHWYDDHIWVRTDFSVEEQIQGGYGG